MNHCATMGNMVGYRPAPSRSERWCARCGGRLARDQAYTQTRCSPCQRALGDTSGFDLDELLREHSEPHGGRVCPGCGGWKTYTAEHCRRCCRRDQS